MAALLITSSSSSMSSRLNARSRQDSFSTSSLFQILLTLASGRLRHSGDASANAWWNGQACLYCRPASDRRAVR